MVGVNFAESVKYLISLGNEVSAMKLGLENTRELLAALGNPENKFLKVQVAGTNGKGSVCVFLNAICVSAGVKAGLYTSPHLISITERIKIDGRDISEEDFARHATLIRETAVRLLREGELKYLPTFFEQVTTIALCVFSEANVELAILETGLGGRLDATTAANAEIAAITSIDYDHQEYLGETLAEIAAEKAAIIHEGSKVVIAEQKPEAMDVLLRRCDEYGIVPRRKCRADVQAIDSINKSMVMVFRTDAEIYHDPNLGLKGRHQVENARVAILLSEILKFDFGLKINREQVVDGLENACHPGRLEFRDNFLFDGAHNVAGATALREFLDEFVTQPITLVFGVMRGKDIREIGGVLFPKAENLIVTKPENSRALTAKQLFGFVPIEYDQKKIFLTDSVAEALETAKRINDGNGLILVTGSLYLVGEAMKILKNESET